MIQTFLNQGDLKCMVWGSFWGTQRGIITPFMMKTLNSMLYLRMLTAFLPDMIRDMRKEGLRPIFMQDNAPVHKAHIVMDWFKTQDIEILEWPPHSPDLNPIEHAWKRLKEELQRRYPDFVETTGKSANQKRELGLLLVRCWQHIPSEFFEAL
jgi:transposase